MLSLYLIVVVLRDVMRMTGRARPARGLKLEEEDIHICYTRERQRRRASELVGAEEKRL